MIVYDYDPETREYKGITEAQESPLEQGVYLLPAHSTESAPPQAGEHQIAVYSDSGWALLDDHRGEIFYDTATRERREIKNLGPVPDGLTDLVPGDPEAVWDGDKWIVPFSVLKRRKQREIWGMGDAILAAVKANYTQAEIESWSKQEQGAKDLAAGIADSEAAQFVAGIATLRGIPVDTLRDKILANVAAYGQLCTAVIGTQQRLDDLIKAAQSAEDVAAVTWPETLG